MNSVIVLGNGESRSAVGIDNLKKIYPIVGCNAIHRDITVDHLICCDHRMVFESLENKNNLSTKIYVRERFYKSFKKIQKNKNIYQLPAVPTNGNIKRDNPEHWGSGPYAILVASLLDHDQIYLIGFDLYSTNNKFNNAILRTKELFGFRLNESTNISEVDWAKDFGDVKKSCLSPESVVAMLNSQLDRLSRP